MIEITENLIGTWYVRLEEDVDFLMGLDRGTENDDFVYRITYRFRYYKDDKIDLTSKDKKNWYIVKIRDEEADDTKVLDTCRALAETLTEVSTLENEEITEMLMDETGVEGFANRLQVQEFAHSHLEEESVN